MPWRQSRSLQPAQQAVGGRVDVVRLLLDAGVEVNRRFEHDLTALMWAAGYGKDSTVRLLLERGADARLVDDRGLAAAEIAGKAGHATTRGIIENSLR